jgi:activator of 2-hydroxyglutaryl-CoA dehydratase
VFPGHGQLPPATVERLSLSVEQADALATEVGQAAVLSARCPVILKTDVTHLANRGEERARIVAGCFDAVGENVQSFLKPGSSPSPVALIGGVAQSRRVQQTFREWLERAGMAIASLPGDAGLYVEALGCALLAAENLAVPPPLADLLRPPSARRFEEVPALSKALDKVRRLPPRPLAPAVNGERHAVILGLDIGSTGSKAWR